MNVERVASLFIRGAEEHIRGNDMVYALTFKEPVDADRLFAAYEALIRAEATLRLAWEEDASTNGFTWRPYESSEVDVRLLAARARFATGRPFDELASEYVATNGALPIRLERTLDGRILFLVNHALANGFGGIHWLDLLLARYAGEPIPTPLTPPAGRSRITRILHAIAGIFWAFAYVIVFALRAGKRAAQDTVDLTHAKSPAQHDSGYAVKTYRFTTEQTAHVVRAAKAQGLSVTGAVSAAVARVMFADFPHKRRVCISLPVDIGHYVPGFTRELPGNFTGSLVVQLHGGGAPLEEQVRNAFKWFKRGVPYWLTRIVGAFAKTERALYEKFAAQAKLPIPSRAPFENFSCAISSPGVMKSALMQKHIAEFSGHTKTQTIFFAVITLNGKMTIEVSFAKDLFDVAEVLCVTHRVTEALLGRTQSSEATTSDHSSASAVGADTTGRALPRAATP